MSKTVEECVREAVNNSDARSPLINFLDCASGMFLYYNKRRMNEDEQRQADKALLRILMGE